MCTYHSQIACARVGELQNFGTIQLLDGKPVKPPLRTLDVNLTAAIYSEPSSYPHPLPLLEFLMLAPTPSHAARVALPTKNSEPDTTAQVCCLARISRCARSRRLRASRFRFPDNYDGPKASWTTRLDQEIFLTSQYGLLGLAKSTQAVLTLNGIRIATVQTTSTPGKQNSQIYCDSRPGLVQMTRHTRQGKVTRT